MPKTDKTRIALLWLLDNNTATVDLEAFGCADDPDETAALYIARVTGLKVTVKSIRQTTAEPPKGSTHAHRKILPNASRP